MSFPLPASPPATSRARSCIHPPSSELFLLLLLLLLNLLGKGRRGRRRGSGFEGGQASAEGALRGGHGADAFLPQQQQLVHHHGQGGGRALSRSSSCA